MSIINFRENGLNHLEVNVRYKCIKHVGISICIVIIIDVILLLIGTISTLKTSDTIFMLHSIIFPLMVIVIIYCKTSQLMLNFNLSEKVFTKTRKIFGMIRKTDHDISDIGFLSCKWSVLPNSKFHLEFATTNGEFIDIIKISSKIQALSYSAMISNFLDIDCLYPVEGSNKYWN